MLLIRDVEMDSTVDDITFDPSAIDVGEVRRLFEFLEFNTLFDRLAAALETDLGPAASERVVLEAEVDLVADAPAAASVLRSLVDGDRPRSEEHTSELQSLMRIPYAA